MPSVFNSIFENELRLIILIDVFEKPQNADMLYAADFMVAYGETFGITKTNLNGENVFKFSEFLSRRSLVQKVLQELSWKELIKPIADSKGIIYQITSLGQSYCRSLDSEYAIEYRSTARRVVHYIGNDTERSLISRINKLSATSLKRAEK